MRITIITAAAGMLLATTGLGLAQQSGPVPQREPAQSANPATDPALRAAPPVQGGASVNTGGSTNSGMSTGTAAGNPGARATDRGTNGSNASSPGHN